MRMQRPHRLAGVRFRRRHAIEPYIVDFCAPRRILVIELDGSQYLDQTKYYRDCTAFLVARWLSLSKPWASACCVSVTTT
jgi:very-short-patch-repair endonuclease